MKIVDIRTIPLSYRCEPPYGSAGGMQARRGALLVEIETDERVIGIGSGESCDGQILVTHDLIGLFPWFTPKFVSPEARVADEIRKATRVFIERTRATGRMSKPGK